MVEHECWCLCSVLWYWIFIFCRGISIMFQTISELDPHYTLLWRIIIIGIKESLIFPSSSSLMHPYFSDFSVSTNHATKSKIILLVITIPIPNCSVYIEVGAGCKEPSQIREWQPLFQHLLSLSHQLKILVVEKINLFPLVIAVIWSNWFHSLCMLKISWYIICFLLSIIFNFPILSNYKFYISLTKACEAPGVILKWKKLACVNSIIILLSWSSSWWICSSFSSESSHTNQLCSISKCDSNSLLNEVNPSSFSLL